MKREEAKQYVQDMLTGKHTTATKNHYSDVATAIDVIYDDFDSLKKDLNEYIEESIVTIDNDRGLGRGVKELIRDKDMPYVWYKLNDVIQYNHTE